MVIGYRLKKGVTMMLKPISKPYKLYGDRSKEYIMSELDWLIYLNELRSDAIDYLRELDQSNSNRVAIGDKLPYWLL